MEIGLIHVARFCNKTKKIDVVEINLLFISSHCIYAAITMENNLFSSLNVRGVRIYIYIYIFW